MEHCSKPWIEYFAKEKQVGFPTKARAGFKILGGPKMDGHSGLSILGFDFQKDRTSFSL